MVTSLRVSRASIRKVAVWACVGIFGAVASGIIGEFAVQLTTKWGWFDNIDKKWDSVAIPVFDVLTSPYMTHLAALSLGLLAGIYSDAFMRRRDPEKYDESTIKATETDQEDLIYSELSKRDEELASFRSREEFVASRLDEIKTIRSHIQLGSVLLAEVERTDPADAQWHDVVAKVDHFVADARKHIGNRAYDAEGLHKPYFEGLGAMNRATTDEERAQISYRGNIGYLKAAIRALDGVEGQIITELES